MRRDQHVTGTRPVPTEKRATRAQSNGGEISAGKFARSREFAFFGYAATERDSRAGRRRGGDVACAVEGRNSGRPEKGGDGQNFDGGRAGRICRPQDACTGQCVQALSRRLLHMRPQNGSDDDELPRRHATHMHALHLARSTASSSGDKCSIHHRRPTRRQSPENGHANNARRPPTSAASLDSTVGDPPSRRGDSWPLCGGPLEPPGRDSHSPLPCRKQRLRLASTTSPPATTHILSP